MKGLQAGFSLVEVLCALLILGVGLVGVTEAIGVSLRTSKESEKGTKAVQLAAARMETLRAEGYFSEGEEEGELGDDFPLYRWRQTIQRTAIDGLYEVAVSIEDSVSGGPIYELRTLLFQAPYSFGDDATESGGARSSDRRSVGGTGRRGSGL